MQVESSCRFLVEVVREPSGELLAQEPLGELGFLADEARFQAVSKRRLPDEPQLLEASLEPIRPAGGGPRLEGIRVTLRHRDPARAPFILDVPSRFVRGRGSELAARLVEEGVLKEGDHYRARLAAAPAAPASLSALFGDSSSGEVVEESYPVVEGDLAALGIGPEALAASDRTRPVFVARSILETAKDAAVRDGDRETGSLLLGLLVEDRRKEPGSEPPGLAVVFTERVAAADGQASAASFTFSPDTFRAARHLAEARCALCAGHDRRGYSVVGTALGVPS